MTDEDFAGLEGHLEPAERDPEAPVGDAVEQATPAYPDAASGAVEIPLEVNEYDAVEQATIIEVDDDYR